jgi:hypothetical protein
MTDNSPRFYAEGVYPTPRGLTFNGSRTLRSGKTNLEHRFRSGLKQVVLGVDQLLERADQELRF